MTLTLRQTPRDSGGLYAYANPIIESWTGVDGKGVALTNVQVDDPIQYAVDAENLDTTASPARRSFRATAGAHVLTVNASGITLSSATLSGNVTIGGTLGVTGVTTLSSNATVGGTLGVTGATTLSSTLLVSAATTITATLNVGGVATFSSNAGVDGTLGVTGTSSLGVLNAGATSVTTLTASSTLGVTGASTLAATSVTTLSVSSTLGVTGTSTLGVLNAGATSVTTLAASSTLNVTGTSTLGTVNAGSLTATSLTLGSGDIVSMGDLTMSGTFDHDGSSIGFFGSAPNTKQTVTGSRGTNAALASLLSALANYGAITDSTSA